MGFRSRSKGLARQRQARTRAHKARHHDKAILCAYAADVDKTRAELATELVVLEADLGDLRHSQVYFGDIESRIDALLLDALPEDADWFLDEFSAIMDRHVIK